MVQEKLQEIRDKIDEAEGDYWIDTYEMGKILVIVSIAVMMVSIPAALSFDNALNQVQNTEGNLSQAQSIIESQDFQSDLNELVLEEDGERFLWAYHGFEQSSNVADELEETEENLDERYTVFQWISLLAILGIVSGLTLIYL